jgi:hypothetical protein
VKYPGNDDFMGTKVEIAYLFFIAGGAGVIIRGLTGKTHHICLI